jgi:hypothetical protein
VEGTPAVPVTSAEDEADHAAATKRRE